MNIIRLGFICEKLMLIMSAGNAALGVMMLVDGKLFAPFLYFLCAAYFWRTHAQIARDVEKLRGRI